MGCWKCWMRKRFSSAWAALLDLRQDRDLGDILGTLLVVAAPMIYTGLQAGGDPGTRDRLENILNIFKRGMGKRPTAEIENKEIT